MPSFSMSYDAFLERFTRNKEKGMEFLEQIHTYTPFLFQENTLSPITLVAGYRLKSDLLKRLHPRKTKEYKLWTKSVKQRDSWRCKWCGSKENLHAHHIVPMAVDFSLWTDVGNGIALCSSCHVLEHSS